jgi:hypothetical protein
MTDDAIVSINTAGGIAVITGYVFVYLTGTGSKLYKVFNLNEKFVFKSLSVLSIISFFYLYYWAGFSDSLKDWQRDVYIASLSVYLLGATLWSIAAYRIVKNKLHPSNQYPALFLTGAGTVGMLVGIAGLQPSQENIEFSFAMIAGILLVIQHAFFDLFYWSHKHIQYYEARH